MPDIPESTFNSEDLAAERARVALEWQLPQPSPGPRRQESGLCCTTRTCPPSAVADRILPWHEVYEGDAVLFVGRLRLLVAMWPAVVPGAPELVGVRLLDGGETQDFQVNSNGLTAVRRYTEGTATLTAAKAALAAAGLDEAAADRDERAGRFCSDCTGTGDGPCADQVGHLDRASEYRALRDELEAGR